MYIVRKTVQVKSIKQGVNMISTVPATARQEIFSEAKSNKDAASEFDIFFEKFLCASRFSPDFRKEVNRWVMEHPLFLESNKTQHLDISWEYPDESTAQQFKAKSDLDKLKAGHFPVNLLDYFQYRKCLTSPLVVKGQVPSNYGYVLATLHDPEEEQKLVEKLNTQKRAASAAATEITSSITRTVDLYRIGLLLRRQPEISFLKKKYPTVKILLDQASIIDVPVSTVEDAVFNVSHSAPEQFLEAYNEFKKDGSVKSLVYLLLEIGIVENIHGQYFNFDNVKLGESYNALFAYFGSTDPEKQKVVNAACLKLKQKLSSDLSDLSTVKVSIADKKE